MEIIISLLRRQSSGLNVLTRREARVVLALAEALFPSDPMIPVEVRSTGVVAYVDDYLTAVPQREMLLMRCMFLLFEIQYGVWAKRPGKRFSKAPIQRRQQCLSDWETAGLYMFRLPFQALRSTLMLAYMAEAEVGEHLGIGDGVEAVKRRNRMKSKSEATVSTQSPENGELRPKTGRTIAAGGQEV